MMASQRLHDGIKVSGTMLLAVVFASSICVSPLTAQTATPAAKTDAASTPASATNPSPTAKPATAAAPSAFVPSMPRRERAYHGVYWGVDSLSARAVESGELIKFSYRVLDAEKAKTLNDKDSEVFMIAPDIHAKLVIPTLEKVGQLRQTSAPEKGKIYWMAFSNPGRVVKRGDRVSVFVGQFHVDGLVVE